MTPTVQTPMRNIILFWGIILESILLGKVYAQETASDFYAKKQYDQAITILQQQSEEDPKNHAIMFNLGNCYTQKNQLGYAILWYRRSLALSPNDPITRNNLEYVESLCVDTPYSSKQSIEHIAGIWSPGVWQLGSIVLFVILLLSLLLYILSKKRGYKKASFYTALFVLPLWCASIVLSLYSHELFQSDNMGVVVASQTSFLSSPELDPKATTILYDGAQFSLDTHSEPTSGFQSIILPNGKQGWVEEQDIRPIQQ